MNRMKLALASGLALAITGCFFDYPDPTVDPATDHPERSRGARPVRDPRRRRHILRIRFAPGGRAQHRSHELAVHRQRRGRRESAVEHHPARRQPVDRHSRLLGCGRHQAQGRQVPVLLQLLRHPAGRSVHRAALLSRRRGLRPDRRTVHRPGHLPALGHDARGNCRGLRARRCHELRRAHSCPTPSTPTSSTTRNGKLWMVYGSYSGGIFILEMDENTGKPLPGQGYGKHLAGGDHGAIEGGYMLYSPESGYYYLFMSFGGLAANDGYNIRIARSRNPDRAIPRRRRPRHGQRARRLRQHRALRRETHGRLQFRLGRR